MSTQYTLGNAFGTNQEARVSIEFNNLEYGIPASGTLLGANKSFTPEVLFQPREFGILNRYSIIKEIYKVQLSPTIVSLASNNETN